MDHDPDEDSVTIVIIDDTTKQEIDLKPGERLLIGREESTAKPQRPLLEGELPSPQVLQYKTRAADVSEKHAEIRMTHDGRVILKDLNSTNGTHARLLPHQDRELQPNGEFLLGRSLIVSLRTPLWDSIDDHGRFESAEDFAAYVQARLKEYGAEARIIGAHTPESRRQRGPCTRLPLPGYQAYILVTWRKDTLNFALERWLQLRVLLFNSGSLCVPLGSHDGVVWHFSGTSEPRRRVLKAAQRIAPTNGTVLLYGKTGVGKDVLAHDIHDHSARANRGSFLPFNCAAIPATLAESLLFGTERGAFSDAQDRPGLFEQAHGGTLFLDEIGELPLDLQAKLLRVIEDKRIRRVGSAIERPVNVRLIAATNRNLPEMVAQKKFRDDLWYRLEGVQLRIPDLIEDDILALAPPLFEEVLREERLPQLFADESHQLAMLAAGCAWPGNARQLRNALRRYLVYRDPELGVTENWEAAMAANRDALPPPPEAKNEPVPGTRDESEEVPKGAMALVDHVDRLLTLTIAREVLLRQRWGAWAELGRRLDLTGAGAQDKIRRLGIPPIPIDQVPDPRPFDRAIEEARSELQPYMGLLRKLLKL